MQQSTPRMVRSGFTLVELLVAITIIIMLAGLTVMFLPTVQEQQRSADGASQLQRWLSIAQQRARRDRAPRGLRLIVGPTVPTQIVSCQYLEQPDDFFVPGSSVTPSTRPFQTGVAPGTPPTAQYTSGTAGTYVSFTGVDFYQGFGPADPTLWAVQPNDYLEINGGGVVHQIVNLIPDPPNYTTCGTLQLAPVLSTVGVGSYPKGQTTISLGAVSNISLGSYLDLDFGPNSQAESVVVTKITGTTVTVLGGNGGTINAHFLPPNPFNVQSHGIASFGPGTTYRIIRAPRITGEEALTLPVNVVVDLGANNYYGTANPLPTLNNGNLDILFAPTGAVISPAMPQGFLALWVRDTTAGPLPDGIAEYQLNPTLIALYGQTGFTAPHPPNQPALLPAATTWNPYTYCVDGLPK